MISVKIPDNNVAERKYALGVLLGEYLGLEFSIDVEPGAINYKLQLQNSSVLEIEDDFFARFPQALAYLQAKALPENIKRIASKYAKETDIISLYGSGTIREQPQAIKGIYCGVDLVGAAFFMLTRWEEYINPVKDKFERFPDEEALAIRMQYSHRPIVDEYVEFLWKILLELGYRENARKLRQYEAIITHDVDGFRRLDTAWKAVKTLGADIVKRRSLQEATRTGMQYLRQVASNAKDPYDTFDLLMDISEANNCMSRFYFIPSIAGETDLRYDITTSTVANTMRNISRRGHVVGIHGSWSSYNNPAQFNLELERLKGATALNIEEGRQHYLRCSIPQLWQTWNDAGLKTDSTMGYYDHVGFRSGTCHPHSTFNVTTQKKLALVERPLIVMEGSVLELASSNEEFMKIIGAMSDTVRRYNGQFVFLWHNNNINHPDWRNYFAMYREIVAAIT